MNIINARLRGKPGLFRIELNGARIAAIVPQAEVVALAGVDDLDAGQNLVVAPFVEPHIHLDATLTAGEPRWNMSGTLFEGIECWAERKETTTHDDIKTRAKKTIGMLVDHGIQHVRTHVDVTDPKLTALKAMVEVRDEVREQVDLQIVAFPQEGIESYANGRALMTEAVAIGADVVGGIPHFENTRDQGVSSVKFLMDLAERTGCLVDVHCDETDDPQSRFLEVLAEEARVRDMGRGLRPAIPWPWARMTMPTATSCSACSSCLASTSCRARPRAFTCRGASTTTRNAVASPAWPRSTAPG